MVETLIVTIIVFMASIICALVAIIYKILTRRINDVDGSYDRLIVTVAQIKNDIKWIKNKLLK